MPNVLKFVSAAGSGNTFVAKTISPPSGALWVSYEIQFPASLVTPNPADDVFTGALSGSMTSTNVDLDGLILVCLQGESTSKWWTYFASNGPFTPAIATDTWYRVDYFFDPGNPYDFQLLIDNVDVGATHGSFSLTSLVGKVFFGIVWPGGWENNFEVWFKNIAVGSTLGGSDIWSPNLDSSTDPATFFETIVTNSGDTIAMGDFDAPPPPGWNGTAPAGKIEFRAYQES